LTKKIHRFELQKPKIKVVDRFEAVAYDRKMAPVLAIRMQRRKPRYISMGMFPCKGNPNKVIIHAEKGTPFRLQVFYYRDNPGAVCIALSGDFIRLPSTVVRKVIKALRFYCIHVYKD
jgi:hypothetical protein